MLIVLLQLISSDPQPGLYDPRPIRYEMVYQAAQKMCPMMAKYPNKTPPQVAAVMDLMRRRANFTNDENRALINHCIMFSQGRAYARQR
jgi:hypothetical protein